MKKDYQFVDGRPVHAVVEGVPVSFERRSYGRGVMYCWAEALLDGRWISLSDPWPCITPRMSELAEAIALRRQMQSGQTTALGD